MWGRDNWIRDTEFIGVGLRNGSQRRGKDVAMHWPAENITENPFPPQSQILGGTRPNQDILSERMSQAGEKYIL